MRNFIVSPVSVKRNASEISGPSASGSRQTGNGRVEAVARYVDILSDSGLKAVLGGQRNPDVLIDILNTFLPEKRRVAKVKYITNEYPGFSQENKDVRIDVICTGEDGTRFVVEVQSYRQKHFFKRCVDYACKVYDSDTEKGDDGEYNILPVYLIGLLNSDGLLQGREIGYWKDRYVSNYTFREKGSGDEQEETIFLIFVELYRFGKTLEECTGDTDRLMFAMKHSATLTELPDGLRTKAFERLFAALEIARMPREVKLTYEQDIVNEKDKRNAIYTAREEGREQGAADRSVEIARSMKADGLSEAAIAKYTNLTAEQVAAL